METSDVKKTTVPKKVTATSLRVKPETRKRLLFELSKANKKNFGRKVRADQLLSLLMTFIRPEHIQKLQQESLSNADRLEMRFREHVKKFGPISKDDFLGQLLGEKSDISEKQNVTNSESEKYE